MTIRLAQCAREVTGVAAFEGVGTTGSHGPTVRVVEASAAGVRYADSPVLREA